MSYSVMFAALLLLTPLLFAALFCLPETGGSVRLVRWFAVHSFGMTLLLILALWVVQTAADAGEIWLGLWLHIDGLGGPSFAILGVIGFTHRCLLNWLHAS
ncbi:hypothetical protein ACLK19_16425 [Escherichia coli]